MSNAQITSASVGARQLLVLDAVVLVVAEALDVDAEHHAAIAHVVQPLADHQRRRRHALERPVVGAARFELRVRVLPQELAGRLAERHQHAAIAGLLRVAHQLVVGAHEHHAARHDGVAVALRAEVGHPLHVLLGLHVPVDGQPLHRRHHVAVWACRPTWASRRRWVCACTATAPASAAPHSTAAARAPPEEFPGSDGSWLRSSSIRRQLEVVEHRAELGVDEQARALPRGCRSAPPSRSSTPPARAGRRPTPCPARAPSRWPGSRRAASGGTTCPASTRTAR